MDRSYPLPTNDLTPLLQAAHRHRPYCPYCGVVTAQDELNVIITEPTFAHEYCLQRDEEGTEHSHLTLDDLHRLFPDADDRALVTYLAAWKLLSAEPTSENLDVWREARLALGRFPYPVNEDL